MKYLAHAYLMALLEINEQNVVTVRHFIITSSEHLACQLQKQTYACIEKHGGDTYTQAIETIRNSVRAKMLLSQPGSLWHTIHNQITK